MIPLKFKIFLNPTELTLQQNEIQRLKLIIYSYSKIKAILNRIAFILFLANDRSCCFSKSEIPKFYYSRTTLFF
ncbi:hypothetical protein IQ37_04025 [Chryseobacterium piperi]|uniref:Uncharacterized protein n=1 Tax=Chryseobacterium piperi TaxID=558152 RepID=A0A086BLL3_9FLAO|nr:hypothetical protein CJF12_02475 [Chryseobacterium piperi]KFF29827.1 hypothetical protein IQ37_04025 [Chryseobacterium piperi]